MATIPAPTKASFDAACRLVLDHLNTQVPMGLWAVTRVENGRQTFLTFAGADNEYAVPVGGGHAWTDSLCIRMLAGEGPPIAPDAQAVPAYAAAGVNERLTIGAFAGLPILEPDGSVFGTLCGVDPVAQPDAIVGSLPLLELVTSLLGMLLAAERSREQAEAAARAAQAAADTDALTGVLNRRGWDAAVAQERTTHRMLADPTVVVLVDLDGLKSVNDSPGGHAAGDDYIRSAAAALRAAVPRDQPVARLGGDEFGVILRRCTVAQAPGRMAALEEAFERAGVTASIGWAPVTVLTGLPEAIRVADAAMYHAKRARRAAADSARRAGDPARVALPAAGRLGAT